MRRSRVKTVEVWESKRGPARVMALIQCRLDDNRMDHEGTDLEHEDMLEIEAEIRKLTKPRPRGGKRGKA